MWCILYFCFANIIPTFFLIHTCIFAWCPSFPSLFRGIPRVWKFPLKVTFSPFEFQIDVCWDTFVCCTAKSVNVCGSDFRKCGKCYKLSLDVFPLYWHTQGISCRLSFLHFWLWFLYTFSLLPSKHVTCLFSHWQHISSKAASFPLTVECLLIWHVWVNNSADYVASQISCFRYPR